MAQGSQGQDLRAWAGSRVGGDRDPGTGLGVEETVATHRIHTNSLCVTHRLPLTVSVAPGPRGPVSFRTQLRGNSQLPPSDPKALGTAAAVTSWRADRQACWGLWKPDPFQGPWTMPIGRM